MKNCSTWNISTYANFILENSKRYDKLAEIVGGCNNFLLLSPLNEIIKNFINNYMGKRIFYLILVTAIWVLANALLLENTNNIPFYSFLILAISWGLVIEFTKKEEKENREDK